MQYQRYQPAQSRSDTMTYRRSGRSGLKLPTVTLGLWYKLAFADEEIATIETILANSI